MDIKENALRDARLARHDLRRYILGQIANDLRYRNGETPSQLIEEFQRRYGLSASEKEIVQILVSNSFYQAAFVDENTLA